MATSSAHAETGPGGAGRDHPRSQHIVERPGLEPAARGDVLVAANVSPDGDAVALWAPPSVAKLLASRSAYPGGPDVVLDAPVTVRVSKQNPHGDVLARTEIDDFRFAHPHIAAMPEGRWLLLGSRCRWTPDGVDPNGAVYSPTGRFLRHGTLGDGIAQVRTTAAGDVWVGYFDEGIFGNFGWGHPGPEPVGSQGLARFDQFLERTWTYPRDAQDPIYDDPFINVDGDRIWATFDPDFPVARISDGCVQTWTNHTGVADALIVDSRRQMALIGENVTIGELEHGTFRPTVITTHFPLQTRNPRSTAFVALGPTLHVIEPDGVWWTTDIDALVAASS